MPQLHLLRKRESTLGFALHLNEWVARCEKILDKVKAPVPPHIHEIAASVRDLETTTQQITCSPDVLCIWDQVTSGCQIGPGLEAIETAPLDQFAAKPPEAICRLVVAEVNADDTAKLYVGRARTVAVAPHEAEIDRPAHREGIEVPFP